MKNEEKIIDYINQGFKQNMPLFFNKITIVDYNLPENKISKAKRVELSKYKMKKYISSRNYKFISRII